MSKVLLVQADAVMQRDVEIFHALGFQVIPVSDVKKARRNADCGQVTTRQLYAGQALQGLLAASRIAPDDPEGAAKRALAFADALLEAESQSTN